MTFFNVPWDRENYKYELDEKRHEHARRRVPRQQRSAPASGQMTRPRRCVGVVAGVTRNDHDAYRTV